MNRDIKLVGSILSFAICALFSTSEYAGGNMTFGVASRAQTMGDAFTSVADDPSAVFYNPAGLTQVEGTQLQANLFPIIPKTSYKNSINDVETTNYKIAVGGSGFFSKKLNDRVTFGLGAYAPFARTTNYDRSAALFGFPLDTNVFDAETAAVLAFKITDKLSIGGGPTVDYNYANASVLGLRQKVDDVSFSGVISALYKMTKTWKVGLTYHFADMVHATGEGKGNLGVIPIDADVRATFKNPAFLMFGTSWQATKKLLLSIEGKAEYWSQAQKVRFRYSNPLYDNTVNFNGKDVVDLHTGLEYRFKANQAVRLGYQYAPRAFDKDGILPGSLDFNTNVYSVGYSYYHKNWRFDLGYEYVKGEEVTSTSTKFNPFLGDFNAHTNTIFLGVNYKFS